MNMITSASYAGDGLCKALGASVVRVLVCKIVLCV
jgi:hypothetical protein